MKIFIPLFTFIIILPSKSFTQDTINWRADYKLKWEDFQQTPDSNSEYKAISAPSISYSLSHSEATFSCKIFCFFEKDRSWVTEKDSILLEHEQGHFNIAELFARKFRKKNKEYKFSYLTVSQDIKKIFNDIKIEKERFNSLYDKETNLSRSKMKQLYWSNKILIEIKKLDEYAL